MAHASLLDPEWTACIMFTLSYKTAISLPGAAVPKSSEGVINEHVLQHDSMRSVCCNWHAGHIAREHQAMASALIHCNRGHVTFECCTALMHGAGS